MLGELYDYAVQNDLTARPGYEARKIKAYVCIDRDGKFVGADPGQEVLRPCIGSAAQGPARCNFPVEKRSVMLSDEKPAKEKTKYYFEMLDRAQKSEPMFTLLRAALEDPETAAAIKEALDEKKVGQSDILSFKVDGAPVESAPAFLRWWDACYREQFGAKETAEGKSRCFITGELAAPLKTVRKISGLQSVGGHASGDAIISGDKAAFCSYGLKSAQNAAVGEAAMSAVNAALEDLIKKGKVLAGAYWLHWYRESVPPEVDVIENLFGGAVENGNEAEDDAGSAGGEHLEEKNAADRLIESVYRGEKAKSLKNNVYYILSVSGASGRVAVRAWQQGSYEDLQRAMDAWWDDLSLVYTNGKGMLPPPPLWKINKRLIKPISGDQKELAAFEPLLIFAILNGNPLPDRAASGALRHIRSKMAGSASGGDGKTEASPDDVCCQILKAWLVRKNREKGETVMNPELTPEYPGIAYHCGRLTAVYAKIQKDALGRVGAGVVQRYYASACTNPALVFGSLSRLSQHHLSKIENEGLVVYYNNLLSEIARKIGCGFPKSFTLKQQAEFALGYYHQNAELYSAKNKEDKTVMEENEDVNA